jgi:hypothetical protein
MGYAVRTDRYRYVEWQEWKTKRIIARELYDHRHDVNEARNVAAMSEYKNDISRLSQLLRKGWREVLPEVPERM